MASYSSRVKADITRWVELGFIDAIAGSKIAADVESHERRSLSFGNVLAMMAALLVAAAILVLVAANWEAIPRVVRVLALFAIILAGYAGGAVLKNLDHPGFGEALWLVAAATFGASMALIGQMYHMSGDETTMLLTWCIATAVAAAALRSNGLTIGAVGLGIVWLFDGFDIWTNNGFAYWYPLLVAALWVVSLWTGSKASRHLLLLSLILYIVMFAIDRDVLNIALLLAVGSAALFALSVFMPGSVERVVQLDGRFPVHCLIGFLTGMFIFQTWLAFDGGALFALCAAVVFAGVVGALIFAGRESRGLRWIAYIGFSLELAIVYLILAGTMLGTAGLFLAAGVTLGLIAFLIIRVEKRMAAPPPSASEGAAA